MTEVWIANSSFEGEEEIDLSFEVGDRIEIVQRDYLHQAGWCVGRLRGKYGVLDAEMIRSAETDAEGDE